MSRKIKEYHIVPVFTHYPADPNQIEFVVVATTNEYGFPTLDVKCFSRQAVRELEKLN